MKPAPPVTRYADIDGCIGAIAIALKGLGPERKVPQPACKPNSVRLRAGLAAARDGEMTIPLAPALLTGSGNLPEGCRTGRLSPPKRDAFLFGLAPCGVLPATPVARRAVRSYRTFSPLPFDSRAFARSLRAVYFLCHWSVGSPRPGITRRTALWSSDFPLPRALRAARTSRNRPEPSRLPTAAVIRPTATTIVSWPRWIGPWP